MTDLIISVVVVIEAISFVLLVGIILGFFALCITLGFSKGLNITIKTTTKNPHPQENKE